MLHINKKKHTGAGRTLSVICLKKIIGIGGCRLSSGIRRCHDQHMIIFFPFGFLYLFRQFRRFFTAEKAGIVIDSRRVSLRPGALPENSESSEKCQKRQQDKYIPFSHSLHLHRCPRLKKIPPGPPETKRPIFRPTTGSFSPGSAEAFRPLSRSVRSS